MCIQQGFLVRSSAFMQNRLISLNDAFVLVQVEVCPWPPIDVVWQRQDACAGAAEIARSCGVS